MTSVSTADSVTTVQEFFGQLLTLLQGTPADLDRSRPEGDSPQDLALGFRGKDTSVGDRYVEMVIRTDLEGYAAALETAPITGVDLPIATVREVRVLSSHLPVGGSAREAWGVSVTLTDEDPAVVIQRDFSRGVGNVHTGPVTAQLRNPDFTVKAVYPSNRRQGPKVVFESHVKAPSPAHERFVVNFEGPTPQLIAAQDGEISLVESVRGIWQERAVVSGVAVARTIGCGAETTFVLGVPTQRSLCTAGTIDVVAALRAGLSKIVASARGFGGPCFRFVGEHDLKNFILDGSMAGLALLIGAATAFAFSPDLSS